MTTLEVLGVRLDTPLASPVLLLKDRDADRCLPIWIGAAEASAIASAMEGVRPPRPLTHDLLVSVIRELGCQQMAGEILDVADNTFLADLILDGHRVSARPSDVAAVAVRTGMALSCPDELMDKVGVPLVSPAQDEVERFREFLESVNPDDFEGD